MKLKVVKILETKQPIKPKGTYTLYQWVIKGELDGQIKEYMLIKSFLQITFNEGMEFNVKEDNYQGNISYTIEKSQQQNKKFGGYSKPTYTQKEFDLLYMHAFEIVKPFTKDVPDMFNRLTVTSSMMATYIISAVNSGVKIEQKQDDNKNNQAAGLTKEFLDSKKDDYNPNEDIIENSEDIPF